MNLGMRPFENIVGKGENGGNQHFLLFPTMFSTLPKPNFYFPFTFILLSANAFDLISSFDKDLSLHLNAILCSTSMA